MPLTDTTVAFGDSAPFLDPRPFIDGLAPPLSSLGSATGPAIANARWRGITLGQSQHSLEGLSQSERGERKHQAVRSFLFNPRTMHKTEPTILFTNEFVGGLDSFFFAFK